MEATRTSDLFVAMAKRSIWIGDPFDPDFEWRKPRADRPVPRPLSKPLPASERLWKALGRRFEKGHLAAHLTAENDWIGLASRRELEGLIDEAFAGGRDDPALPELRELVRKLDGRTIYYLVASRKPGGSPGGSPGGTGGGTPEGSS